MSCRVKFFTCNMITAEETEISVLDGTPIDPFFPLSNLQHPFLTKVVRTTSGNETLSILIDTKTMENKDAVLLSASDLNGFGYHGTVDVYASNTTNFTGLSPVATVTPEARFGLGHASFDPVNLRFWKMVFNSEDYVELGKIFLGRSVYLQNNNMDFGWSYQNLDRSKFVANRYGQRFIDKINDQLRIRGDFKYLNKEELEQLLDAFDYVGKNKPFWFIVDETETIISDKERFAGYFYFNQRPTVTNESFGLYSLGVSMHGAL